MALAVDGFDYLFNEISKELHYYEDILSIIGIYYISKTVLSATVKLLDISRIHLWPKIRGNDLKRYGQWALITGSSDGIGLGFAHALAKRGLNLVLISRSEDKLEKIKDDFEKKYSIKVNTITHDFIVQGEHKYDYIIESIKDKDVGILINNVDIMPQKSLYFEDLTETNILDTINVNCVASVMLTHKILPMMIKRNRGLIVNISSISGLKPTPFLSVYSASKVFLHFMTDSLAYEYKDYNIHFQTITPFASKNLIASIILKEPCLVAADALSFSEKCVQTFGYTQQTAGIFTHDILCILSSSCYNWIHVRIVYLLQTFVFGKITRKSV